MADLQAPYYTNPGDQVRVALPSGSGVFAYAKDGVGPEVTPHAGGGQALATPLIVGLNPIAPAVTASDSVQLPAALAGSVVIGIPVFSANLVGVFAKNGSTDTINGSPGTDQFDIIPATGNFPIFVCPTDGAWFTNIEAD